MTFGEIINELKNGKTVRRCSWWFDKFIILVARKPRNLQFRGGIATSHLFD